MLFDRTYFKESNINRKPFIWSQDKIITKFGQKKWQVWFWEMCMTTAQNLRKNFI